MSRAGLGHSFQRWHPGLRVPGKIKFKPFLPSAQLRNFDPDPNGRRCRQVSWLPSNREGWTMKAVPLFFARNGLIARSSIKVIARPSRPAPIQPKASWTRAVGKRIISTNSILWHINLRVLQYLRSRCHQPLAHGKSISLQEISYSLPSRGPFPN